MKKKKRGTQTPQKGTKKNESSLNNSPEVEKNLRWNATGGPKKKKGGKGTRTSCRRDPHTSIVCEELKKKTTKGLRQANRP